MDAEERNMLEETAALAKENNRILRRMQHWNRISTIARIAYWGILVGAAIGLFYFVQPYIDQFASVYDQVKNYVSAPVR